MGSDRVTRRDSESFDMRRENKAYWMTACSGYMIVSGKVSSKHMDMCQGWDRLQAL